VSNTNKAFLFAMLLYVASFASCLVSGELASDYPDHVEYPRPATYLDYVSSGLLLFAIGSTIASRWLQSEDDEDD
jgi:hypothetical protein